MAVVNVSLVVEGQATVVLGRTISLYVMDYKGDTHWVLEHLHEDEI